MSFKGWKIENMELNPRLWKDLPQEILEMVIGKLPFSRAVAFRGVSKLWRSVVIPRAADAKASRQSVLLYFNFRQRGTSGSARWLQLCSSKYHHGETNSFQDFQPSSSFPSPEPGEVVQLVNSEGGLLFFAFIKRERFVGMVREIVVSNPLTAKSRSLGLPRPLQCTVDKDQIYNLLVGVVMDAKTGNYRLVAAGRDETAEYATFLYRSSTSTWSDGPSLYPALRDVLEVDTFMTNKSVCNNGSRSVCHNGNLYWKTKTFSLWYHQWQPVIKFDIQHETWRIILLPESLQRGCILGSWQMVNLEGKICLWHLHERNGQTDNNENRCAPTDVEVLFDQNNARYPQRRGLSCEFKSMQGGIDGVEELLPRYNRFAEKCRNYFAFNEHHVLYHVVDLIYWNRKVYSRVIAHDTIEDSYSELDGQTIEDSYPDLEEILTEKEYRQSLRFRTESYNYMYPSRSWRQHYYDLSPSCVWGFAASLTSLP